jgi:hypothetical protein
MKLTRTYISNNKTHTEILPEGRYLNVGERLMPGDLYLPVGGPCSPTHCIGDVVIDGPYVGNYFRPNKD